MKRATVMMISKVKQGKVFSLVLLLAMLLSACGNDRGSDGILRSVVRIKLELLPDEREYRDLHADIFVDGNLVGSVENGSSEILKLPVGLRSIKLSLERDSSP